MRAVSFTSKCDSPVEIMKPFVRSRSTVQVNYYNFGCTALTYKKLIVHFRGAINCDEIMLVQLLDIGLSNKETIYKVSTFNISPDIKLAKSPKFKHSTHRVSAILVTIVILTVNNIFQSGELI